MKKRNLTLALVSILAGITLTSCETIPLKKNDGAIVTINNGDANAKTIDVENIFNKYLLKSAGISAYYNAICEIIVRGTVDETDEINKKAERSVEDVKYQAKSNAETNGTKYDAELETLLTEKKAEDLKELKEGFVYDLLKEKAYDDFFDNQSKELLSRYVNEMLPYHVRHILVKVSASGTDAGYNGQITEQEALNLAAVIDQLAGGTSFGTVAKTRSEDAESAKAFGDLGLMSTATSYVNEFKLGVYAYDALFNQLNVKNATQLSRVEEFNMTEKAETYLESKGIGTIDYKNVTKLKEVASITKDKNGAPVNSDDATYYPRNVYFNNYFNEHTMNLIVNDAPTAGFIKVSDLPELSGLSGLDNKYVLCDESNRVILAVRAGTGADGSGYQGIHFITVQKSPIVESNLNAYYVYKEGVDFYDKPENLGKTFVSFVPNNTTEYKKRAETIENEVKGFDKMIDAAIYRELKKATVGEKPKFVINNNIKVEVPYDKDGNKTTVPQTLTLEEALESYINNTIAYYDSENDLAMNKTWNEWIEKLELYDSLKVRVKPLVCADQYKEVGTEYTTEGGLCYVKK